MVQAASGYPDSLVGHMRYLAEKDYMFLDVSNMRQQENGVGPAWNKAVRLYYRNVSQNSAWKSSATVTAEGLVVEEKNAIRELRQSNIYCFKITEEDTETLQFSYSNDDTLNTQHYYRTATYKAGDVKGNLYAYLASYTVKDGDNSGSRAYMIGKVKLPEIENAEEMEENSTEESTNTSSEENVEKENIVNTTNKGEKEESTNSSEEDIKNTEEKEDIQQDTNSETEEYEVEEPEILADSDIVTIKVVHDFNDGGGAVVVFTKNGTATGSTYTIGTSIGTFQYDTLSTSYNGFYVKKGGNNETGNTTEIRTTSDIKTAVQEFGNKLSAVLGGWTGKVRTLTLSGTGGDASLNIPTGTYTKADNTYYAKATFYDYYSDRELEGTPRKNVGDNADSSAVRVQAGKFNRAIAEYFKGKNTNFSSGQSPLYFGDFWGQSIDSNVYYKFVYNNNNGENNKKDGLAAPKQGLVNNKLVNGEVVMGTSNTVVPYFNEAFLRGDNYYEENIGYVFNNVDFPFELNDDGYWEFNSYDSSETLRMKKDSSTGRYFLDRVGSSGEVKGAVVYTSTSKSNFFPFNDHSESAQSPKLNYAYGIKIEIPFYMTADGKVTMEDGTKEDIVFNFLGDDDIWIYIDDDLVLDIGGDHGAVKGEINFATHKAAVTGSDSGDYSTATKNAFTKNFSPITPSERHILTLYYMERGLWESNMQIYFNFPQSNKLEVEKEVKIPTDSEGNSLVNSIFDKAINDVLLKQIPFPISIKNMATSGTSRGVEEHEQEVNLIFDNIDSNTSATLINSVTNAVLENSTSGAGRTEVLKYNYPGEKKSSDGQDVTDNRSFLLDYSGNTTTLNINTDQIKTNGYIQLDAYSSYSKSSSPFVALVDSDGDRIGGWGSGMVYSGGTGTMNAENWTTLKLAIAKMEKLSTRLDGTSAQSFDYDKISKIQFAYWVATDIYIDNIYIKAPATYSSSGGFTKDQNKISDYGSIGDTPEQYKLMPINGAEYILNPVVDENGNTYSYSNDGNIYLKHTDMALFTDQFRRESYLSINEVCDQNVFKTTWEILEDGEQIKTGTGTAVEDGRTEETPENSGVTKPAANTMLFKSYDPEKAEDTTYFYNLSVKYTNELKVGSIKIKKNVVSAQNDLVDTELPYKIRVTFSNIAGLGLERENYGAYTTEDSIYAENSVVIDGNTCFEITGIPAGTEYTIEEIQEDRDDFILTSMSATGGNDVGTYDTVNKTFTGIVVADTDASTEEVITIINNINPVTENGKFSGKKIWDTAEGNTAPNPLPEGVRLRLQRRLIEKESTDTGSEYQFSDVLDNGGNSIKFDVKNYTEERTLVKNCMDNNEITIKMGANFSYDIAGLPLYALNSNKRQRKYEYRLLETVIIKNEGEEIELETTNTTEGNAEIDSKTGYIVSGGVLEARGDGTEGYDITNTYNPETNLQITKVSGDDIPKKMPGVTLRLEKLVEKDGKLVPDETFNSTGYWETDIDENGMITFLKLTDGRYRLTEMKTVSGYSLLAAPINITISRLHGNFAEGTEYPLEADGNTLALTISNQGLLSLPMTGSRGRWYVMIAGVVLILGGEGIWLWNLYHNRRKRHVRRKR